MRKGVPHIEDKTLIFHDVERLGGSGRYLGGLIGSSDF